MLLIPLRAPFGGAWLMLLWGMSAFSSGREKRLVNCKCSILMTWARCRPGLVVCARQHGLIHEWTLDFSSRSMHETSSKRGVIALGEVVSV